MFQLCPFRPLFALSSPFVRKWPPLLVFAFYSPKIHHIFSTENDCLEVPVCKERKFPRTPSKRESF